MKTKDQSPTHCLAKAVFMGEQMDQKQVIGVDIDGQLVDAVFMGEQMNQKQARAKPRR